MDHSLSDSFSRSSEDYETMIKPITQPLITLEDAMFDKYSSTIPIFTEDDATKKLKKEGFVCSFTPFLPFIPDWCYRCYILK